MLLAEGGKLEFLTSTRFWKFAVAITIYVLIQEGFLAEGAMETIAQIVGYLSATSATVGTVDRFGEYVGAR